MESQTEDRGALLAHYREMRAGLLAAVDGLSEAQLIEPSLDGWSVKDHLAHLVAWDELRASDVERISAGFESAYRMSDAQAESLNEIAYDLRRGHSLAQVLWELEASHQRLLHAIEQALPRGLDGSLYGEAGLVSDHETQHTEWIRRWRDERTG